MAQKEKKIIFGRLKLIPRLAIIFSVIPLILFSLIAIYIYQFEKKRNFEDVKELMAKELNSLIISVKIDRNILIEQNNISLSTFQSFISSNKSFFYFEDKPLKVEATNYYNGIQENVAVQNWKFRGDTIVGNNKFISALAIALKTDLVISQKTKIGYVNITSTNENMDLVFFPYSNEIVYTVENGETYSGIMNLQGNSYFVRAVPLYISGKIEGMLMSYTQNIFSSDLSEIFGSKVYLRRGYPFAVDSKGTIIIHPTIAGQSIFNSKLFNEILKSKYKSNYLSIDYIWPENIKGEKKYLLVQFIPELEIFIAVSYFDDDLKAMNRSLRIMLFFAVTFSTLIILIFVLIITNFFLKRLQIFNENIEKLSRGIIPSSIKEIDEKENISILETEKKLIENYKKLLDYTKHLRNRNYLFKYEKWSNEDKVGDNLNELNNYLKEFDEESKRKLEEQEKLIWLNEGVSKFIEILKYQVIEIKDLGYRIISQIVEYVGANEGGFFIVNQSITGEKFLDLLAAYAMHKEKLLMRSIPFGVGFLGRVAVEKKTLFLTEIPDDYTKISTALGQGIPKSIVVLPLIFNDDVIGVIELASFEVLTSLQLEFLEKITENISANLAMWRASQQTAKLLKESQEQTILQQKQQKELEAHLKELEKLRDQSEKREIELNSMIKAVDTTALLVEYDVNGMILSANSRFLETLERNESELIGKHHRDITSMDILSKEYRDFWNDLLDGRTKRFIESYNIKDKTIWLSQNYVPIVDKDDNVFKILNIAIDVTENKVLERQLRAQVREISKEARTVRKEQRKVKQEKEEFMNKELEYKAVMSAIEVYLGHVEFSIDGQISFMNKKFGEILIYDIRLLENKNIKDFISDDDIEVFKLAIEKAKKGEQYSSQITFITSSMQKIKVNYTLMPAIDLSNKVEKIVMVLNI